MRLPLRDDLRLGCHEHRRCGRSVVSLHFKLTFDVGCWHKPAVGGRAEHVRSAQVFQTSTCSAIAKASSTSMPRYLTVLSILVCPSRSWTALRLPVRR